MTARRDSDRGIARHAAAFEIVEALRMNLSALDGLISNSPETTRDLSDAMDAGARARMAIRRAAVSAGPRDSVQSARNRPKPT